MANRLDITTTAIHLAMEELENMPCGGICEDGPTLEQLDAHVDETGGVWGGDAMYHAAQRAWRILEAALDDVATIDAEKCL